MISNKKYRYYYVLILVSRLLVTIGLYGQETVYQLDYDAEMENYREDPDIHTAVKQNCEAAFVIVQNSIQPYMYDFADNSQGNINTWFWDFGDGVFSNAQNPAHFYIDTGLFNVCLTVSNPVNNCSDSACHSIQIKKEETYNIGGQVFIGNQPIDEGIAILYTFEDYVVTPVAVIYFDTLGYFDFFRIRPGQYLISAELSSFSIYYPSYLPTFYGDASSWTMALVVVVNKNIWDLDIHMLNNIGIPELASLDDLLLVYPNPFHQSATFEIKADKPEGLSIEIFDQYGRMVKNLDWISGNQFTFTRENLEKGMYIYVLKQYRKVVFKGKLIIY